MSSQMSQMSQLEPLDVKFRALLDPIKDLAANWDIDIADSLTDYLEELESLRMSSDGQNNLNFAAAGLLIQGSTAVYSKKVEFLHQLVLQSLSQITNSKSSSSNGNGKNKNMSCSLLDDERLIFGTDPSYLLLDDAVEEGSNINLVDLPDSGLNNTRRRSSARHSMSGDFSRASMVLMHSVLQEDHGGSSLRMSSCQMDPSGALIMGGLIPDRSPLDRSMGQLIPAEPQDGPNDPYAGFNLGEGPGDDWGQDDGDDNDFSLLGDNDPQTGPVGVNQNILTGAVFNENKGTKIGSRIEHAGNLKEKKFQRNALSLMDPHAVTVGSKPVKKGRTNKIPKGGSFMEEINRIKMTPKIMTSFDFLDENFSGGKKIPMIGLMNKLFAPKLKQIKLQDVKLRVRRENNDNDNDGRKNDFYLYKNANEEDCVTDAFNDDNGNFSDDDNEGENGTGEFWVEDCFQGTQNGPEDGPGTFSNNLIPGGDLQNNGDNDFFDGGKNPGVDDADFDPFQDADDDLMKRVELALSDSMNNGEGGSYESICKKHIQSFMDGAEQYARETQLSKRVADWTCRLEPILRAQELAPEYNIHTYSDLVLTQVGSVSEMDLERRFRVLGLNSDENTGGEEIAILNTLRTNVRTDRAAVDFQEIVGDEEGRSSGEVCRVFLACLMLANAGNLDLIPQPAVEKPCKSGKNKGGKGRIEKNVYFNKKSSFHVRILRNRRNQDIEEFRAPSVFTEY